MKITCNLAKTTDNLAPSFVYVELSRQASKQFVDKNAYYLYYNWLCMRNFSHRRWHTLLLFKSFCNELIFLFSFKYRNLKIIFFFWNTLIYLPHTLNLSRRNLFISIKYKKMHKLFLEPTALIKAILIHGRKISNTLKRYCFLNCPRQIVLGTITFESMMNAIKSSYHRLKIIESLIYRLLEL